jgi:hypothetical protein
MKVILVSAGIFQDYLLDNIKNLILHNNTDITLITESKYFDRLIDYPNVELVDCQSLLSDEVIAFHTNSRLDRQFRSGFWHLCSLRLFYIYEYIKNNNLTNVVHIENDVLVYEDLENIKNYFKKDKVYAPFDSPIRVIPSVIFIPNYNAFKPIIDNYNYYLNDMQNLAQFDEIIIEPLPIFIINDNITKFNKNYFDFGCIFDAAAMGQYLGGVDKRNDSNDTRGFVNETCVIKYDDYNFIWKKKNELFVPYIKVGSLMIKIINLHIHSKDLQNFLSDNPIEQKFIPIYDN